MNARRRALAERRHVRTFPHQLTMVPRSEWPDVEAGEPPVQLWKSRRFIVLLYAAPLPAVARISVRRCDGLGGIPWDDLQEIKETIGLGDLPAVEYYPPKADLVHDANMRHLWVLGEAPPWAWRSK